METSLGDRCPKRKYYWEPFLSACDLGTEIDMNFWDNYVLAKCVLVIGTPGKTGLSGPQNSSGHILNTAAFGGLGALTSRFHYVYFCICGGSGNETYEDAKASSVTQAFQLMTSFKLINLFVRPCQTYHDVNVMSSPWQ